MRVHTAPLALGALLLALIGPGATSAAVSQDGAAPRVVPDLRVRTVVDGLATPWDVRPIGRGRLLVTERDLARLSVVRRGVRRTVDFPSNRIWVSGETGLMSIAVVRRTSRGLRVAVCHGAHPRGDHTVAVTSFRLDRRATGVSRPRVLLDGLPASSGRHGGCRLLRDRRNRSLWVGTGDAATSGVPRDLDRLGGKVLRIDARTGRPWRSNPWSGAGTARRYVVTYGHRNVQGLAQRRDGRVWSIEHGPSRDDEVNRVRRGGDFGWEPGPGYDESVPMTDHSLPGVQRSARWSSGAPTLATSGAAWVRGREWGALRGTLAVAALKAERVLFMRFSRAGRLRWVHTPPALRRHGRLRSVTAAPGGSLLVTTSNGIDDRVLRVSPR